MKHFVTTVALGALLSAPAQLEAQKAPTTQRDSQVVVFVCEHGTVKSVVASAYFNALARARRLPVRAVSRGTNLDPAVPAIVRDGLLRDGITLGAFAPTLFSITESLRALAVVTFDRPAVVMSVAKATRVIPWDNLPAVSVNYDIARDSIRYRVRHLVDSLVTVAAAKPRRR